MSVEHEQGTEKDTSVELAVHVPRKYQVLLYNDDYTPMAFVVEVVQHFFHCTEDIAVQMMMKVHVEGRAICGVFSKDVAETITTLVNEYARLNEYPLLCAMEAV